MWIVWLLACSGAGIRHEVALADLAPLGAADLASLQDEEHALSVANTGLAGARVDAERAEARVREAEAERGRVRLDLATARAAGTAARASGSTARVDASVRAEADARARVTAAEANLAWAEAERRAREAAIEAGQTLVVLRRAELEAARFDLLAANGRGVGYRRADFQGQVEDARAAYDGAWAQYEDLAEAAVRAAGEWRRLAPEAPPPRG